MAAETGDPGALPWMDVAGVSNRRIDRCRDRNLNIPDEIDH